MRFLKYAAYQVHDIKGITVAITGTLDVIVPA